MICPHCKKPIERTISKSVKKEALKLHKRGYSTRGIQMILGNKISFSSVARLIKKSAQ